MMNMLRIPPNPNQLCITPCLDGVACRCGWMGVWVKWPISVSERIRAWLGSVAFRSSFTLRARRDLWDTFSVVLLHTQTATRKCIIPPLNCIHNTIHHNTLRYKCLSCSTRLRKEVISLVLLGRYYRSRRLDLNISIMFKENTRFFVVRVH